MPNPATPTALRIVTGNPSGRPLPVDEFQPEGVPVKPKWLNGKAAARWDALAPQLIAVGVLTAVDVDLFAGFCALAAEFEQSRGKMIAGRIAQMRALAGSFGLDPSSRTKVKVKTKPTGKSKAETYFDK